MPPAVAPSAVSGKKPASTLCLIPRVSCCFEHTQEFQVRCRKMYGLRVRGRALHKRSRVANDTRRTLVPSKPLVPLAPMAVHIATDRRLEKLRAVLHSVHQRTAALRARAACRCHQLVSSARRSIWCIFTDDDDLCHPDSSLEYAHHQPPTTRASCIAHNCLCGPILQAARSAILRPSPCDERGGQHLCVHRW